MRSKITLVELVMEFDLKSLSNYRLLTQLLTLYEILQLHT